MEQLILKMQSIIKRKLEELETTSPDIVDYPVLEEEISDAAQIWILLRSINGNNKEVKLDEIKLIISQTTSASVYDTLTEYLKDVE